jgi:hypothetical protein
VCSVTVAGPKHEASAKPFWVAAKRCLKIAKNFLFDAPPLVCRNVVSDAISSVGFNLANESKLFIVRQDDVNIFMRPAKHAELRGLTRIMRKVSYNKVYAEPEDCGQHAMRMARVSDPGYSRRRQLRAVALCEFFLRFRLGLGRSDWR